MSRNEGGEEEKLLVWRVFFSEKAHPLVRVTVEREGMSVREDRVIRNTLQSNDLNMGERTKCCLSCSECCEFRQVYSSSHSIIITSHDQFS